MKRRVSSAVYAAVLVAAAVIALLIYWQVSSDETPPVLLPRESAADGDLQPADDQLIKAEISPATVQAAIASLDRANAYSRSAEITLFHTGGSLIRTVQVSTLGDRCRIGVTEGDRVKNILISGEDMWIWYQGTSEVFATTVQEGFSGMADRQQSMLSYEELLEADAEDILEARYDDFRGEPCICAVYRSGPFDYVNHTYISVLTGLLMGAEIYSGEELIYSMVSSAVDLTAPSEEIFTPPT